MNLVDFYKAYLASLNVQPDSDGRLTFHYYGLKHPLTIKGTPLALPTQTVLQRIGKGDDLVAFHPMSEVINRGESPVLQELKKLVRLKISQILMTNLKVLVDICADTTKHKKLSPSAHQVLTCLPEADEKTVKTFDTILKHMEEDEKKMCSIYLKRQGVIGGNKYARLAVFRFPLYDEFEDDDGLIFGTKIRKKDYRGFKDLIEFVLPDIDKHGVIMVGSNHMVVPYLDSLTKLYYQIAKQLNKHTATFSNYIEDKTTIDLDWANDGEIDWNQWKHAIVPLAESMGEVLDGEAPSQSAIKPPQLPQYGYQPPVPPSGHRGKKTIDDLLNNVYNPPRPAQPPQQPIGVVPQYGYQPQYQAPQYPPQPQYPVGVVPGPQYAQPMQYQPAGYRGPVVF